MTTPRSRREAATAARTKPPPADCRNRTARVTRPRRRAVAAPSPKRSQGGGAAKSRLRSSGGVPDSAQGRSYPRAEQTTGGSPIQQSQSIAWDQSTLEVIRECGSLRAFWRGARLGAGRAASPSLLLPACDPALRDRPADSVRLVRRRHCTSAGRSRPGGSLPEHSSGHSSRDYPSRARRESPRSSLAPARSVDPQRLD
jgi:hypothetical protein